MDRVLSARLDEKVIEELDFATRKLHMTKKQFLEEAIRMRAKETRIEERLRILHEHQERDHRKHDCARKSR